MHVRKHDSRPYEKQANQEDWWRSPTVTLPSILAAYTAVSLGSGLYAAHPRVSQAMPKEWFDKYQSALWRSIAASASPSYVAVQAATGRPLAASLVWMDPALEARLHQDAPWLEQLRQRAERIVQENYRRRGLSQMANARIQLVGTSLPNHLEFWSSPAAMMYPERLTNQPPLFSVFLAGRRHPGFAAHELGHIIDVSRMKEWQRRLLNYSSVLYQTANPLLFAAASALAPDPVTAALPALGYAAATFPALAAEWRASSLGNRLLREVAPHLRRYRAGIGLPTYAASFALPLAGMGLNWLAGDRHRPWNWSDAPVMSGLTLAGTLGLMGWSLGARPMLGMPHIAPLQAMRVPSWLPGSLTQRLPSFLQNVPGLRQMKIPRLPAWLTGTGVGLGALHKLWSRR